MLIERIEDKGLSHYSYIVACEGAGLAAVIDPRRDVDVYLEFAETRGLRIAYVLETHIHADFASGAHELAERTGAEPWLSAYDTNEVFEVSFPHHEMRHGDEVGIGNVRLRALHTPGHTPEHLSFLLFDDARSTAVPMVLFSGDFLFVGSLGRPDLLGEEAKRGLAKQLYASVRTVLPALPDGLEVAPAHGAGSMCGAGMSGRAVSTLGFERIANPYLDPALTEDAFIARILGSVPPFPDYYRRMKALNARGAATLDGLPGLVPLPLAKVRELASAGHLVVDLRDQLSFGAGHVPGAFGLGAGTNLSMWASWVLPYEQPMILVGQGQAQIEDAVRSLVRVGLDDVRGYLDGGMDAWIKSGGPLASVPQLSPPALAERLASGNGLLVVDVRTEAEFKAGHVAGARNVMGGYLPAHVEDLRRSAKPIAIVCGSGYRSTVAASVLKRAGIDAFNVTGGMSAWTKAGLPVTQ